MIASWYSWKGRKASPSSSLNGSDRKATRRRLRGVAYLRRNRCSGLLAGLLTFILVQPLVADSAVGATFLALGTLGILLLALWAQHARRRTLLIVGILALLFLHGADLDRLRRDHAGHQDGAP